METILRAQTYLSIATDITAAYAQISATSLRPAINRMEHLARVDEKEWEPTRVDFDHWYQDAVYKINEVAADTNAAIEMNARGRIRVLERKIIEAEERTRT